MVLLASLPVRAEDANPVLAKVNGSEIRQSDVALAEEELGPSLAQMDPASKKENVLAFLIDMKIVAKAAEAKKIEDRDDFKARLAFTRNRLLMDSLLAVEGKAATTDEAMKKVYEDASKQITGEQEVHARHILVETEDEAKAIEDELKKGADFAELAKKKSKDPGASDGGDLGFFTKDQMVPEFSAVAFSLEPGKISDPVKSQFGWHIIKVEEKRNRKAPDFEQVKAQIETYVTRKAQADYVAKLREAAKVERMDQPAEAAKPDAAKPDAMPSLPPTPRWRRRRSKKSAVTSSKPIVFTIVMAGLKRGLRALSRPSRFRLVVFLAFGILPMSSAVSPLAPTDVPDMPAIAGVKLATAAAGIRYKGRTDVLLAVMDKGTAVAGVFTRSKCPSAPVEWCRAKLGGGKSSKGGSGRALVVNSGNANAFTGKTGRQATALTAAIAAKALGCRPAEVFLASTGVIGEPLDATKFDGVLGTLAEQAAPGEWMNAAKAIMTTDTFPKVATATVKLGKARVTINGMAKGAGMIAPDMATMLAFVFTDAPIAAGALQALLKSGVEDTFNAVTIDGDTSTSDTLLAFATGAAAATWRAENQPRQRSPPEGFHQSLPRRARRSGGTGGARRRRRAQAGRDHRRGRDVESLGAPDRDVGGEFAAGEDRDRRRGRQLGPRGDGGRQGRRTRRPRQALDLVQRHPRRQPWRARSVL